MQHAGSAAGGHIQHAMARVVCKLGVGPQAVADGLQSHIHLCDTSSGVCMVQLGHVVRTTTCNKRCISVACNPTPVISRFPICTLGLQV